MTSNPFTEASKKASRAADSFALDIATVESVEDDNAHRVRCRVVSPNTQGAPLTPTAVVPRSGDVNVPQVGSLVVIGYVRGKIPIVIGTLYTTDSAPSYKTSERTIGIGDGFLTINQDGSITASDTLGGGGSYTDEDAQDAVGTILGGNFLYDDTTPSITLANNSIDTTEIDESIAPTWTGLHTFSNGVTVSSGQLELSDLLKINEITEPSTPSSGNVVYTDSADGELKVKDSSGTVQNVGEEGGTDDSRVQMFARRRIIG